MTDTTKKRKIKRVSKTGIKTYLNLSDERFLKEKLKENLLDEKGKHYTMSSIIRKYVHLGLINEKNTQHAQYSLRDQVVRKSLFRLMDEFHEPMQNMLTLIREENAELKKGLEAVIANNDKHGFILQNEIANLKVDLLASFDQIKDDKYSELAFKNILILRTVFYVFLLAYHHKVIPNKLEAEKAWIKIVKVVHRKAGELSMNELVIKDTKALEYEIRTLAGASFDEAMKELNL